MKRNDINVKVNKLTTTATLPQYQTSGAAGFDFHSSIFTVIMPGETMLIGTGLAFQIPPGFELQIRPRSGLSAKTKIRVSNSPGTVDEDYRGEVKILLDNTGSVPFTVNVGDRIAQGVIAPVYRAEFELADSLEETERGTGAFGSTGK